MASCGMLSITLVLHVMLGWTPLQTLGRPTFGEQQMDALLRDEPDYSSTCRDAKPFALRLFEGQSPAEEDASSRVLCNDQSPAGYYHRLEIGPDGVQSTKNWVIYLEGGNFCNSEADCAKWHLEHPDLASSKQWKLEKTFVGNGLLSSNRNNNPYLYNANKIYIPYCSSDLWTGNQHVNSSGSTTSGNGAIPGLSFMGAKIVRAVVADLVARHGLDEADQVLLSGNSAGGLGVALHLDYLRDKLQLRNGVRRSRPYVHGLVASGWYVHDNNNCVDNPDTCLPSGLAHAVRDGYRIWSPQIPESCLLAHPLTKWNCIFLSNLHDHVKGNLTILHWMYDTSLYEHMSRDLNAYYKASIGSVTALRSTVQRTNMRNASKYSIAIMPTCLYHGGLLAGDVWNRVTVKASGRHNNCTTARIVQAAYMRATGATRKEQRSIGCHRRVYANMCTNPQIPNSKCPHNPQMSGVALKLSKLEQVRNDGKCRVRQNPTTTPPLQRTRPSHWLGDFGLP